MVSTNKQTHNEDWTKGRKVKQKVKKNKTTPSTTGKNKLARWKYSKHSTRGANSHRISKQHSQNSANFISLHIHRTGILQVHGPIPIDEIMSFLSTREKWKYYSI